MIDSSYVIQQLDFNKNVFSSLFSNVSPEIYHWRPKPEKWNLLQILCHLFDEEREDFRARVKHTLETPDQKLPSFDPQGVVTLRKYSEWDYDKTLVNFIAERTHSVDWLNNYSNPKWENTVKHPRGDMSAYMFLTNWLAHDYLHIRQINRLKYQYLAHRTQENLGYAGYW